LDPNSPGGKDLKFDRIKSPGFGIRGAITLYKIANIELGIAATYHPESKSDLMESQLNPGYPSDYWTDKVNLGKYKSQYFALGAQAEWSLPFNPHLSLEFRREKIETKFSWGDGYSTTITRPWLKAGIGHTFYSISSKPFIRLEAAYALKNYDTNFELFPYFQGMTKGLAPQYQIGIYGGVHF